MIGEIWERRAAAVQIPRDQLRIVNEPLGRVAQLLSSLTYYKEAAIHAQTQTLTTLCVLVQVRRLEHALKFMRTEQLLQRLLHRRQQIERQSSISNRLLLPRTSTAYKRVAY